MSRIIEHDLEDSIFFASNDHLYKFLGGGGVQLEMDVKSI
jgi:hypothetical protein